MAPNDRSCGGACPSDQLTGRGVRHVLHGYAATPSVTELMLQRMFLGDPPGNYDRILDFSTAVPPAASSSCQLRTFSTTILRRCPTTEMLGRPSPEMATPSTQKPASRTGLATARWAWRGSPACRPEGGTTCSWHEEPQRSSSASSTGISKRSSPAEVESSPSDEPYYTRYIRRMGEDGWLGWGGRGSTGARPGVRSIR